MSQTTEHIHELVEKLNRYRHEYYNEDAPSVSDAVYDHLYDELARNALKRMEKETGIILSNSPTQTVGYKAVSSLEKVQHRIPLLSLDKTKLVSELASFVKGHAVMLMLKLDGLTVKLVYENGKLVEGSTRGNGDEGELITHNIAAFRNVPLSIPFKGHLPKRSRYYQGNIDLDIISAGEDYRKLKKSFVIFICTFDPFGEQRHIYTFENRCAENPSLTLGDETTKIFLNTKGNMHDVDPEMQEFLSYVENTTDDFAAQARSPLIKEIHKRVTEVKESKEMEVEYMTLLQRDRENLELGREEGTLYATKIIKLHSQGMDDNSIASSLQLDLEYVNSVISDYEND